MSDETRVVAVEFVRPADIPRTCSDEALREAVVLWLTGSDGATVAAKLGISVPMAAGWTQKRGWKEMCARMRDEVNLHAHGGMQRCISMGLKEIEDRLLLGEKGQYYTTDEKTGVREYHETRSPIPAWQIASITEKLVKHKFGLEDRMTGKVDDPNRASIEELSRRLARYADSKPENIGRTIDVTPA